MRRVRDGRSVPRMALQPSSPTLRESVDELSQRLARIGADPVPDTVTAPKSIRGS
jgi:hypothetical protein